MVGERSHTGTYIEGVGDEVVVFISTLLMVAVAVSSFIVNKFRATPPLDIHPENQEQVNATRSQLGLDSVDGEEGSAEGNDENLANNQENERGRFNSDQRCPICLQDARLPVETNCGHQFCAHCIITYWRFGNWLGAINCPVCRQQVTLLLRNFSSFQAATSDAGQDAAAGINDYNRRFSGEPRPVMDYIRDIPALLRHMWGEFFSLNGLLLMFRIRIVICAFTIIVYLLSPFDFLPEAVFGVVGFLDDVFVIILLLVYMTVIYRNLVTNRE